MRGKTFRANRKTWDFLVANAWSNAGPSPSITGMREQYWGKEAYIVVCCNYAFHVSEKIFYEAQQIHYSTL